jgi:PIN domain nuclease of toxin-antitoxin system
MRALLDTHALLWWLIDSDRLSDRARAVIADAATELYWSAASSWEVAIKTGLGRLSLPEPPRSLIPRVMREQALLPLEVTHAHALAVAELPEHHRDPFDRLLVAQAGLEKLPIVSADRIFEKYETELIW